MLSTMADAFAFAAMVFLHIIKNQGKKSQIAAPARTSAITYHNFACKHRAVYV